jgi:hypothetical protein
MLNFFFSLSLSAIFMFGRANANLLAWCDDVTLSRRPISHAEGDVHASLFLLIVRSSFNSARINWALDRSPK